MEIATNTIICFDWDLQYEEIFQRRRTEATLASRHCDCCGNTQAGRILKLFKDGP